MIGTCRLFFCLLVASVFSALITAGAETISGIVFGCSATTILLVAMVVVFVQLCKECSKS